MFLLKKKLKIDKNHVCILEKTYKFAPDNFKNLN